MGSLGPTRRSRQRIRFRLWRRRRRSLRSSRSRCGVSRSHISVRFRFAAIVALIDDELVFTVRSLDEDACRFRHVWCGRSTYRDVVFALWRKGARSAKFTVRGVVTYGSPRSRTAHLPRLRVPSAALSTMITAALSGNVESSNDAASSPASRFFALRFRMVFSTR